MLASVSKGSVKLQMTAGKGAMGPVGIDVYLAGDANGNKRVGAKDLHLIRTLLGVRQGQPGYSLSADVNGDGVINVRDWQLARSNLGVSTLVRPLSASVALSPTSNQDGTGVVTTSTVLLSGQTEPGATVRLLSPVSTTATAIAPTAKADSHGNFQISINVPTTGVIPVQIVATDRFGQKTTATTSFVRGDVVIAWDRTLIAAIRAKGLNVGLASRDMAMVMGSIYDASQRYRSRHAVYHTDATVPASTSAVASASTAAYDVLVPSSPIRKPTSTRLSPSRWRQSLTGQSKVCRPRPWPSGRLPQCSPGGPMTALTPTPCTRVGTEPGQWRPTPPDLLDRLGTEPGVR